MNHSKAVLYQLPESSQTQMMGYVLVNSDGGIAVIDGGNDADGETLFRLLQELGGEHPIVEKWFLTHFHPDHVGALLEILREHPAALEIRSLYYNFPSDERVLRETPGDLPTVRAFAAVREQFAACTTTVHTGDVIPFGSICFKVLFMPDDSIKTNVVNNCSTVLRCDIGSQRILFLADLGPEVSAQFSAMWPDSELRADFVQMAHHGQGGATRQIYARIAPKACLWPTPLWLWENDIGTGRDSGPWKTLEVRQWMAQLHVTRHYISHQGLQRIQFPFDFDAQE